MFSGLVPFVGSLAHRQGQEIGVEWPGPEVKVGDSISVNGVCLTVTRQHEAGTGHVLMFDLSEETLAKTTLGNLPVGQPLNLEPALGVKDALGGHIVQGHVDGTGRVAEIVEQGTMKLIWFEVSDDILLYFVPKASVTIDGVSLTIADIRGNRISISLIPYTLQHTTLGRLRVGDVVNVEADILGKYVTRYLKKT